MFENGHKRMILVHDANPLTRRELPKLGGSSAGFIVLIIVLSLIAVSSIAAVYILLRHYEQSDEERNLRRRRHRSFEYSSSSSPPDISLREKWNGLLSRLGLRKKPGWIQQGDDDWDAGIGDEHSLTGSLDPPKRPPLQQMSSVDSDSVSLTAPSPIPINTGTTFVPPTFSARPPLRPTGELIPSTFSTHSGEMSLQGGGTKFLEGI